MERVEAGTWIAKATGAVAFCIVLTAFGCKRSETQHTEAAPGSDVAAGTPGVSVDPATAGEITGVVSFLGKPPERLPIDMSQDPVCSMTGGTNLAEQYVVTDGKLANVYVYVKSGPAAAMKAASLSTSPVVLDQKGCRYVPHVIAVMRGGTVEVRNSDATMHNVHTMPSNGGSDAIDVSQGPQGKPEVHRFATPEVMLPVRCNNHPWMNAFINVAPTPFFAVTDAQGRFAMHGVPAGHYTLGFVHERMGEKDVEIDVTARQTVKADQSFGTTGK